MWMLRQIKVSVFNFHVVVAGGVQLYSIGHWQLCLEHEEADADAILWGWNDYAN